MQKNTDNNSHDAFSELFRQKLENHTFAVDDGAWDAIHKGLAARKRKRLIPLWWLSAAAVLALSVLIFNLPDNELSKQTAVNKTIEMNVEKELSEKSETEIVPKAENQTGEKQLAHNVKQHTAFSIQSESNENVINQYAKTDDIYESSNNNSERTVKSTDLNRFEADSIGQSIVEKDTAKTLLAENKQENKKSTDKDKISTLEVPQNEPEWEDPLTTANNNEWVVLASMASGRSSSGSAQFLAASNSDLYTGLLRAPGIKTAATILEPADFSSRKFHAPISFGLRAGKQMSQEITIETGLVYTYLLTDLESQTYTARLNLHYLGIPVNAKWDIWTNRQWSIYASGGAMVEKGLRSVYIQEQRIGNQTITTTASTNIVGFQWSVNAAMGVAYNFVNSFDFYFEPGFSYFFDNDQPLSIRSDRQFAPGIEAGVRFLF